jgi:hypothetical protein
VKRLGSLAPLSSSSGKAVKTPVGPGLLPQNNKHRDYADVHDAPEQETLAATLFRGGLIGEQTWDQDDIAQPPPPVRAEAFESSGSGFLRP